MTRRELVKDTIAFRSPHRVPIWYFNRDQNQGDVALFGLSLSQGDGNEWGYKLKTLDDGTMGHPDEPVLPEWGCLAEYTFPTLRAKERLASLDAFRADAGDRYLLGGLGITGFTTFTFLRGFANAVTDLLTEMDLAAVLLDRIFGFETQLVELAADAALDGVHFADDWGTQEGLIINPLLWRTAFKERYRRQFERAHQLGLHVWFHCCGNILEIVNDLHEIGVDVLNISQLNVVDIPCVGRRLRGRQCFMVPISYQTVSISGTVQEIRAEAQRLYHHLAAPRGGFIGYVEDYACMGMSEENYQACGDAFRNLSTTERK